MENFIIFFNAFCSYLLLVGVFAAVTVVSVFLGIQLRKNKNKNQNPNGQKHIAEGTS